jgi:CrcB protein
MQMLLLSAAGAAGTLARYALGGVVQRLCGSSFPWGTLAVNVLGCFLFGLIWTLAEERLVISGRTRFILLMGFMGAFTTFSTYAFESAALLRDSEWWRMAWNILAQNVLGIAAVVGGLAAGQWLIAMIGRFSRA